MNRLSSSVRIPAAPETGKTVYPILLMISATHLLNDMMQSVIPAVYPLLKARFGFSFAQIGIITLVFQMTSSLLQPVMGTLADRHPRPYSLALGMCFTLAGLLLLSVAPGFAAILLAVALVGWGSSVFHPESSRVAQLASGGRKGLAQSIFQVGGNTGSAAGPLLAALVVIPFGQRAIGWLALAALLAIFILIRIGRWYKRRLRTAARRAAAETSAPAPGLTRRKIRTALLILTVLVFSKYFYIASMTNYFTFFLMEKFSMSVQHSQYCLFAFLAASAAGTLIGGPVGDRFGRKYVIWGSILGAAPFTLLLPYASLPWTIVLSVVIGVVISSAFSAILVYATDLMPGKVGMIAGVFFGLMFGLGGLGSAFFGWLADRTSIEFIFRVSTLLPLLGVITGFLPDIEGKRIKS
ncbi:MFS transporter [Gallalistipes aquisgranensis]|mgnify:CR=1 FL=1|uniref:MFS transporter n=1 Tax=Gallalistipes aquisgranensis TaxID=2779358 RepID=UPI001CF7F524|nr:MFS transporter [Gallalistipes aquisgranensis]